MVSVRFLVNVLQQIEEILLFFPSMLRVFNQEKMFNFSKCVFFIKFKPVNMEDGVA